MNKITKIIGITGGIGSGKSAVSEYLKSKKYKVYNSDLRAKFLINNDLELINNIINLLGKDSYDNKKNLNKKIIAEKIFNNKELLQKLNNLVHPKVDYDFNLFLKENKNEKFIFKESAIIFESNSEYKYDFIVLVTANQEIRINRVIQRDFITENDVLNRIKNQIPEEDKIKKVNYIIYNNHSIKELHQKIHQLIKKLNSI